MTSEPNNNKINDADEIAGNWFDSEHQAQEEIQLPRDPEQIRRTAELQLVHSLLTQLADRDKVDKERRIQNLMARIPDANNMYERLYRFTRPFARYGVAAAIIISVILLFTQMPTSTAKASIDKLIAAIDKAGDRTYKIRIEADHKGHRPPPPGIPPQADQGPGERASLNGATLYLRGNNKFVLYWLTPSGKTVINGSDGHTNWHIRPDKPVLVSSNLEAFRVPMPPELAAILSMDLKQTLLQIRDNYKIKYAADVNDTASSQAAKQYLDAVKINRSFPGPQNIEIWADAQTGLLQRIEFADIHIQGEPSPQRLTIELVNQTPLSDNWFTHQAHHDADAQIDSVSK